VGQTFDNAMQAQPSKLVGDGALADVVGKTAGEWREMFAQVCAAEAIGKQSKQDDGVPEGLNARIGEAQSRGALPTESNRTIDGLETILSQHAIMAEALDLEQAAIGRKTDFAQFWQIAQTLANAEIVGVVDGGLGAQGAVFLVVLLDARVLVIDIQGRRHVLSNDAGAETSGGSRRNPAIEDEPDFFWSAEVEILTDDVLEEEAAVLGLVEDLGERELGLQDGNLVAVSGLAIRTGEGMRQSGQPFAQQGVDLVAGEVVADLLQARWIGAAQDAVVERLEGNASVGELALGILMAVKTLRMMTPGFSKFNSLTLLYFLIPTRGHDRRRT